jgi:HK97 family phage major capsid protein
LEEEVIASIQNMSDKVSSYKKDLGLVQEQIAEIRSKAMSTNDQQELKALQADLIEIKSRGGRLGFTGGNSIRTAASDIAESFAKNFRQLQSLSKRTPELSYDIETPKLEYKAQGSNMIQSADLTGNSVNTYMQTPAVRGRRKFELRDLLPVIPSGTGNFVFFQQNAPTIGVGSIDFANTQGSVKQQLEYYLTAVTVTCNYLAGFVRFSKQMAADLGFLQSFLANELVEDYKRTESGAFIPILDGAATGSTAVNGATVYAEKIINWIANLLAGDYTPNGIVTTAQNWATLLLTKPDNYSTPGSMNVDADGQITICGIPVMVQNNMPTGKTLVGDFTRAAIIQAEGLSVAFFEQDSDNVQRNLITARVEARVGLAVLRPDAFVFA